MLGDIDTTLTPSVVELFLCLPNRSIIGKLNEAYKINHKITLGNINELEFSIPPYIDRNNIIIDNPNMSKIKDRYIVKLVKDLNVEYYIINGIKKSVSEKDVKVVKCKALQYELRDKTIRIYNETSITATQALTDVLTDTIWNIGYIDAVFDLKFRSFDFTSITALDAVFQIATTYNALIVWDTENREINFYQKANIGTDKGLTINYGKYLKGMDVESNPDEMCTRLKVYGKDDLSIQRINPTGENHVEDFTYFLYPFQRDELGETITPSDYMSEELCHAILDYNELLLDKTDEFSTYLASKQSLELELTTENNTLTTLLEEMIIILDKIDVAKANGDSTSALIIEQNNKQIEIDAQKTVIKTLIEGIGAVSIPITFNTALTNENLINGKITIVVDGYLIPIIITNIDTTSTIVSKFVNYINEYLFYDFIGSIGVESNILDILYYTNTSAESTSVSLVDNGNTGATISVGELSNIGIQASIITLKEEVSIENNFTSEQIIERNQFIIEKEWIDENYVDDEDLYEDAWIKFADIRSPQINASVDIVDFLRVVECQRDWDKLGIGDVVKVRYQKLNIDIETKIIEIVFDYDDYKITLTIANTKEIETDEEKLIKMLYKSVGTSTQVDMNRYKWDGIETVDSDVNNLINLLQGKIKEDINLSLNENVSISRRGIIVTSPDNPENILIIQNGVLAISNDYGNTWGHAITTDGIVGDRIYGRILVGVNLYIDTGNGDFTVDETGVTINGSSLTITNGISSSNINDANWVNLGEAYNGVVIDAIDGLVITKSDNKVRTILNATEGIKIQKSTTGGASWTNKFYADSNGDLTLTGNLSGGTIEIGSNNDVFKADLNGIYLGDSVFNYAPFRVDMAGKLYAEDAEISGSVDCTNLYLNGVNILNEIGDQIDDSMIDIKPETIQGLGSGEIVEYVEVEWTAGDLYFYFNYAYDIKPCYVIQPSCSASVVKDENDRYIGVMIPASAHGGALGTIFNLIAICKDPYDPLAPEEPPIE